MKADYNRGQKVSLFFYSEEDGKRTMVDKWAIELGKKYIIGRSKKKVDISIQDITISRVHSEFIFYDKDKIMIKDFNSSNGTYINKNKIAPNKEYYCSIRDIISIGDEKNELIFAMEKNEKEEGMNINDFDKITETKNKNEEINQNKNKKYEESIKDNKYYNKYKRSKSFEKNSSSLEKNIDRYNRNKKYSESDEEKYNYKDRYKDDKYQNSKHKRKRNNYRSRSRSNSIEFNKPYIKRNIGSRRFKRIKSKLNSRSSSQKSGRSPKKNKHKNILSYIIKHEEEIEKENDKRQIRLYNQYLKIKEEMDSKSEINNLPNLLPVLTVKSESDSDSYEEKRKDVIRLSPLMRKRKIRFNRRLNKFDQIENKNRHFFKNKNSRKILRRKND